MTAINRPAAAAVFAEVDKLQGKYEADFRSAIQNVNRMKAKAFWDAGWEACERAYKAADAATKISSN